MASEATGTAAESSREYCPRTRGNSRDDSARRIGEPGRFLTSSIGTIDRLIRQAASRRRFSSSDRDDFRGWVYVKLIEDDYRRIRLFDGRSPFPAYLTAVVNRLSMDYADRLWGRWRPSAAARSKGVVGIRLDSLINRDGLAPREAVETLILHPDTSWTRDRLLAAAAELQRTPPPRPVSLDKATPIAVVRPADIAARDTHKEILACLSQCWGRLTTEQQEVLRRRFFGDQPPREIARETGVPVRAVYARAAAALRDLRAQLEARGLTSESVVANLGECSP